MKSSTKVVVSGPNIF